MKKILIVIFTITLLVGCKKFEELNTNPKLATEVPAKFLVSSAQKNLVDVMTSSNVNTNIFRKSLNKYRRRLGMNDIT